MVPRALPAALQHHRASLAQDLGDLAQARRLAEGSLALWRELNDAKGLAEALNLLGLIAKDEGDTAAAQHCFEEALRLLWNDDHARRGMVLNNLALLASRRGDVDEAQRLYQEGLTHQRSAGDWRTEATTLGNLGVLAHKAGEIGPARRLYRESLTLRRELRDRHGIAVMLNNLGELAEQEGDLDTAVSLFVHAERILRDLQSADLAVPAESLQRLAEQWGAERWAELRAAVQTKTWEEIVERGEG
jgi:tetratricopeptide (TPR) repeat protein